MRPCSQTWHKATAVGDTTKAYFYFSNSCIEYIVFALKCCVFRCLYFGNRFVEVELMPPCFGHFGSNQIPLKGVSWSPEPCQILSRIEGKL